METGKVYEIAIRKVSQLSLEAQREVIEKLRGKPPNFKYEGFAKIEYEFGSPLFMSRVDPIEGNPIDFFRSITANLHK